MIQAAQTTTGTLLDLPFDFSETGEINGEECSYYNASSLNTSPL